MPATAQSPERGEHGSSVFRTYCVSCHGESGRGDGPLAQWLRRPPPTSPASPPDIGAFPTEKVYRIIDGRERVPGHGGPDMPVWVMRSCDRGDHHEEAVNTKILMTRDSWNSIQCRMDSEWRSGADCTSPIRPVCS